MQNFDYYPLDCIFISMLTLWNKKLVIKLNTIDINFPFFCIVKMHEEKIRNNSWKVKEIKKVMLYSIWMFNNVCCTRKNGFSSVNVIPQHKYWSNTKELCSGIASAHYILHFNGMQWCVEIDDCIKLLALSYWNRFKRG